MLREQRGETDEWSKGLYTMSIDLAKRPDVRELLSTAGWDLVVVDEAHSLSGRRLQLVDELRAMNPAPALLLASSFLDKGTREFSENASIIDARLPDSGRVQGKALRLNLPG